ncbi:MAG: PhnD/SsuA/transferrin family substrate-binding protein, partial [Candidatus Binatia bacterium]
MSLLMLIALGGQFPTVFAASCETPNRLGFSFIPRGDVKKETAELQPLLEKLQAALGIPVEVYIAPSYGAVVEALLSGAVQLARLGPASYVSAKRIDPQLTAFASYTTKATVFQTAGPFYHSLLIVSAASRIRSIDSLRGKRLALVDPDSTSGAL